MKHRFIVTLSDMDKTRSFTLLQALKKYFIFLVLAIIFAIFAMSSIIGSLQLDVNNLENNIKDAQIKKEHIIEEYQRVTDNLRLKSVELSDFQEQLSSIEKLVGLEPLDEDILSRLKNLKISSALQNTIFNVIPNGHPIPYTRISSNFGNRKDPYSGKKEFHKGIDLVAPSGTPVVATADALVRFTRISDKGFGNMIILSHNYGFETIYAHLKSFNVKDFDIIAKGDVIGYVGNSGKSTGTHLHYGVKIGLRHLDPKSFMDLNSTNLNDLFKTERRVPWEYLIERIKRDFQQILQ